MLDFMITGTQLTQVRSSRADWPIELFPSFYSLCSQR